MKALMYATSDELAEEYDELFGDITAKMSAKRLAKLLRMIELDQELTKRDVA